MRAQSDAVRLSFESSGSRTHDALTGRVSSNSEGRAIAIDFSWNESMQFPPAPYARRARCECGWSFVDDDDAILQTALSLNPSPRQLSAIQQWMTSDKAELTNWRVFVRAVAASWVHICVAVYTADEPVSEACDRRCTLTAVYRIVLKFQRKFRQLS